MPLHDRIALIVGGGAGLGRAIAGAYASEGATLYVADRNEESARETLTLTAPTRGTALCGDITDADACHTLVETCVSQAGRIDILVNCAAICLVDDMLEVTPERWDRVFDVNARGAFFLIQAAAKAMIPQRFGRILTITSPASKMGFPHFLSYAASKAAVDSISRAAAVALAPHGITVNTIAPGRMTGGMIDALEADLVRVTGKSAEELRAERTKGLPMNRRVTSEEVAQAAVWLASDAASYVTAERFNFTGGMELS
ncbi:MAG: SDR family oxidoreductase [candidate division Zixibacteria bacterium]|nr:SDR family oxidoreductase [candidate division Zixibacteria bacterium]